MQSRPAPRGADVLVSALRSAGDEIVFSLSGNQIMPVYDALLGSGIRLIHARHENAAVYMAEGYAQATGRIGVALLTAGAGFLNGLGAVASARASETPLLLLSGDAPAARDGMGAFQEMAQTAVSGPLVKAARRATSPDALADLVAELVAVAGSGRPGPVHLALPVDVLEAAAVSGRAAAPFAELADAPPDTAAIAGAIAAASRPIVIAGPVFCRPGRQTLLAALSGALDCPLVATESPRGLRDPALGALAGALPSADLIVLLGKQLDFTLDFGQPPAIGARCRFVQIDAESDTISRSRRAVGDRLVLAVESCPVAAARSLAEAPASSAWRERAAWRGEVEAAVGHRPAAWRGLGDDGGPLHPALALAEVRRALEQAAPATLVIDGGEFGQWAQAIVSADVRIINGPSGAIGGAIGYAMAAKAADPRRTVLAVMGDGTAGFHLMEIETAVRERLPFVAVVGNDARWNAEHQIQIRSFGADRTHSCGLLPVRYDEVAAALGGHGEHVERARDVAPAIARAFASGRPAVVNVAIDGLPAPLVTRG